MDVVFVSQTVAHMELNPSRYYIWLALHSYGIDMNFTSMPCIVNTEFLQLSVIVICLVCDGIPTRQRHRAATRLPAQGRSVEGNPLETGQVFDPHVRHVGMQVAKLLLTPAHSMQ